MTMPKSDQATDQAQCRPVSKTGDSDYLGKNRPGVRRRVAFLGAGYIADWHAQSICSVANVELVAVCEDWKSVV